MKQCEYLILKYRCIWCRLGSNISAQTQKMHFFPAQSQKKLTKSALYHQVCCFAFFPWSKKDYLSDFSLLGLVWSCLISQHDITVPGQYFCTKRHVFNEIIPARNTLIWIFLHKKKVKQRCASLLCKNIHLCAELSWVGGIPVQGHFFSDNLFIKSMWWHQSCEYKWRIYNESTLQRGKVSPSREISARDFLVPLGFSLQPGLLLLSPLPLPSSSCLALSLSYQDQSFQQTHHICAHYGRWGPLFGVVQKCAFFGKIYTSAFLWSIFSLENFMIKLKQPKSLPEAHQKKNNVGYSVTSTGRL